MSEVRLSKIRVKNKTDAKAYVAAEYLDQLRFSGGKSVPCHPAYQVVATTSSPTEELLRLEPEVPVAPTGDPLGAEAELVAAADL